MELLKQLLRMRWSKLCGASGAAVTIFLSLPVLFFGGDTGAQTGETLRCAPLVETEQRTISCRLPSDIDGEQTSAAVRVALTGATVDSEIVELAANDEPTSWLFLIDVSNPARGVDVQRGREFIADALGAIPPQDRAGVAFFASELNSLAVVGSARTASIAAANALTAQGLSTELYRNAIEGIRLLENEQNERRALVLLSDGRAEDSLFEPSDVVEAAQAAGVVVHSVGFPLSAQTTPDLQGMRLISDQTGGQFVSANPATKVVPAGFAQTVSDAQSGAGSAVQFASEDPETTYSVELSVAGAQPVLFNAVQVAQLETGERVTSRNDNTQTQGDGDVRSVGNLFSQLRERVEAMWADSTQRLILLAVAVFVGLLFLWFIVRFLTGGGKKKANADNKFSSGLSQQQERSVSGPPSIPLSGTDVSSPEQGTNRFEFNGGDDGTEVVPEPSIDGLSLSHTTKTSGPSVLDEEVPTPVEEVEIFVIFQVNDCDSVYEFHMTSSSIKIGRSPDNDLVLDHKTVHRAHAVVHRSPDGDITVRDFGTKNGILVDGERVETAELKEGSEVQLGNAMLIVRKVA